MKKQIMILTAALLVGMTSCEKDEKTKQVVNKPKTKTELLTQKVWDLNQVHVTTKAGSFILLDENFPMVGTVEFKANKTGESITPEEGKVPFTWDLKGDSLFVDGEGQLILKLTDKEMDLKGSFTEQDSTMGELNVTIITSLKR